jgi:hypothetical protein
MKKFGFLLAFCSAMASLSCAAYAQPYDVLVTADTTGNGLYSSSPASSMPVATTSTVTSGAVQNAFFHNLAMTSAAPSGAADNIRFDKPSAACSLGLSATLNDNAAMFGAKPLGPEPTTYATFGLGMFAILALALSARRRDHTTFPV